MDMPAATYPPGKLAHNQKVYQPLEEMLQKEGWQAGHYQEQEENQQEEQAGRKAQAQEEEEGTAFSQDHNQVLASQCTQLKPCDQSQVPRNQEGQAKKGAQEEGQGQDQEGQHPSQGEGKQEKQGQESQHQHNQEEEGNQQEFLAHKQQSQKGNLHLDLWPSQTHHQY